MLKKRYLDLMDQYQELLESRGAKLKEFEDYNNKYKDYSSLEILGYALFMVEGIRKFVEAGDIDKANRWLGFLQGVFWAEGLFSINEMRDQNRG